jgi:hypothetical protein
VASTAAKWARATAVSAVTAPAPPDLPEVFGGVHGYGLATASAAFAKFGSSPIAADFPWICGRVKVGHNVTLCMVAPSVTSRLATRRARSSS